MNALAWRNLYPVACLSCFVALVGGCVAKSDHVDQLTTKQAETADLLAKLADLHADLAEELQAMQAATARKVAFYAQRNSDESIDLSNEPSGINVAPIVKGALSGNWLELGMGLLTTAGLAFGGQQMRKAKRVSQLAEEVRDLDPEQARKVWMEKKVT